VRALSFPPRGGMDTGLNGFSLFSARRRDAEGFHLAIEVAALDAEGVGGARDIAVLRGQGAQDVAALELLAGIVQRQRGRAGGLRRGDRAAVQEREVAERDGL